MLYLVKLDNAYKIGFSKDVESRIKDLFITHLDCKLISTKFGNKRDEKAIHLLCKKYNIKNELFEINPKVEEIFNTYICYGLKEDIEKQNKIIKSFKEVKEQCDKVLSLIDPDNRLDEFIIFKQKIYE